MEKNIFITGDRSMHPVAAVGAVDALIKDLVDQHGTQLAIGTGTCMTGVERAVRYLIPEDRLNIVQYTKDDEGNINFADAFKAIEPTTTEVVFIHLDPLASRIGKAVNDVFPEDKVRMPFQELLAGL